MSNAKQTRDMLMELAERVDKFHNQPLNARNRAGIVKLVKELTDQKGFHRKDENKIIHLYWGKVRMDHGMAADIEIGIDKDKKIWTNTDGLWGTISGINERVEEERAYMRGL